VILRERFRTLAGQYERKKRVGIMEGGGGGRGPSLSLHFAIKGKEGEE